MHREEADVYWTVESRQQCGGLYSCTIQVCTARQEACEPPDLLEARSICTVLHCTADEVHVHPAAQVQGEHLGFCSCTVLICTADEERVVASRAAEARVAVCAQHAPDDVPQMGNIVYVRQCACYQNVPLP